jgi:DNA-binding NarL/FixJ family response regulator
MPIRRIANLLSMLERHYPRVEWLRAFCFGAVRAHPNLRLFPRKSGGHSPVVWYMVSIAAWARSQIAEEVGSTVIVASADRDIRARMVAALTGSELAVRAAASTGEIVPGAQLPDLLVMHCEQLSSEELTLLRDLKREHEGMRIVIVCQTPNGRNARRAIDGGVDGFVFTERLENALAPTVGAVLAGQTAVPTGFRASMRRPSLSYREKQILGLVVMGHTNSQIGSRLFLAESTVKSHLSSAFTKLGVRSRSEAAALILDPEESLGMGILGIVEPPERPEDAPVSPV